MHYTQTFIECFHMKCGDHEIDDISRSVSHSHLNRKLLCDILCQAIHRIIKLWIKFRTNKRNTKTHCKSR